MIAPDVTRTHPPLLADERGTLAGFLDFHRSTLLHKCAGLTDEQLTQATCPPSNLTLLGLVRHMAEVERWWFRRNVTGAPLPDLYCSEESPDGEFENLAGADPESDLATFHAEVELARQAVADLPLEHTFPHPNPKRATDMSLRWVYVHMIEEYARHNGHADLLRERIDGATGE